MAKFTISPAISAPNENDTMTINIGVKYSFTSGNSVIVSGFYNSTSRFEAVVDSYDSSTGDMTLIEITNIQGFKDIGNSPIQIGLFNITLAGQRGSKILHGTADPNTLTVGRTGDTYINDITGEVYYK